MTISRTTVLSQTDWQNLHGNELYIQMLRNKLKVEIEQDKKVARNSEDFKKSHQDTLLGTVLDYIKTVPEDLVYYHIEDVYGHKTIYVYFANPMDKENFFHYYNTQLLVDKVTK